MASDTRNPFKASSEISACSAGWPSLRASQGPSNDTSPHRRALRAGGGIPPGIGHQRRVDRVADPALEAAQRLPLTGAKVLAARLYGVGPVAGLALTCWPGGAGRFSSSRKAVRFTGLDITVHSSDRKGPPGRLSRQGPPVLRWAVYEAGETHARAAAPDHGYYAAVAGHRLRRPGSRPVLDPPAHSQNTAAIRGAGSRFSHAQNQATRAEKAAAEPLASSADTGRAGL